MSGEGADAPASAGGCCAREAEPAKPTSRAQLSARWPVLVLLTYNTVGLQLDAPHKALGVCV